MESIVFFVIAMAINLLFKGGTDKKKMDAAKKKRAEELKNNPVSERARKQMETWSQEAKMKQKRIEEFNMDINKHRKQAEIKKEVKKDNRAKKPVEAISYVEKLEMEKEKKIDVELDIQKKNKDSIGRGTLINAIIWSEILGEAKSIQNTKRGM